MILNSLTYVYWLDIGIFYVFLKKEINEAGVQRKDQMKKINQLKESRENERIILEKNRKWLNESCD